MPDPIVYLQALLAAAGISALIVFAFRLVRKQSAQPFHAAMYVLATASGLLVGFQVLQFSWPWPPANALSRFLTIVLPAIVIVELLASDGRVPERIAWLLRSMIAAATGRVLLHDSVYLKDTVTQPADGWTPMQMVIVFTCGFIGLLSVWIALQRLSVRSSPGSIALSLAMTIGCAGCATMLAGYIKGGASSIPIAAAIAGTTLAAPMLASGTASAGLARLQGTIGIAVVSLFSLVCIGRFFGQLSSASAIVIFLSPLLCWCSEFRRLRSLKPWQVASMRLVLVALPLLAVLFVAKQQFDKKLKPLLAAENFKLSPHQLMTRHDWMKAESHHPRDI